MLLADVAAASQALAATSSRTAKVALLADLLRRAQAASGTDDDVALAVAYLSGQTRQRRTGIGWASLRGMPPPAATASLTLTQVDRVLDAAQAAAGAGATAVRQDLLARLLASATEPEQQFLAGLLTGELRQGAQAAIVADAVAAAAAVPREAVRRAVTLSGDLPVVAVAALVGGARALASFGLRVGVPLSPMLAQPAPDLEAALRRTGPAGVEWKLDGIRIQVHRDGDDVAVFTRTGEAVTDRVPEVVQAAREMPVRAAVLDGEVIALRPDSRPQPFQVTSSRVARHDADASAKVPLTPYFFDALHVDGADLLDLPGSARRAALVASAPAGLLVPRVELVNLDDAPGREAVQTFAGSALAHGHEGVLVKGLDVPYSMGRRGSGWVKVKPRITLDLVVLAAEWGHGRRTGWLSNLHLGARDEAAEYGPAGGFVMLGKTFKGLSDAMLVWQTRHLQALASGSDRWRVDVRPELVVEIAFDGVQDSPRYPAGLALRFARVLAHRPDKPASQADTVATVRAHRDAARA